jgi:DNA-binding transcriptional MerR regulator
MDEKPLRASMNVVSSTKDANLTVSYRKQNVIDVLNENGVIEIKSPSLAYYARCEIIIPDVANPSGRGEVKYYSAANLVDVAVVRILENNGLSLKAIAKVSDSIRNEVRGNYEKLKNFHCLHLVLSNLNTGNSRAFLRVDEGPVKFNMENADSYLIIDLTEAISRMKKLL